MGTTNEQDIREAKMQYENQLLIEKIAEYKLIQLEDTKYKQILESLIEKGIINQEGEEIIKF